MKFLCGLQVTTGSLLETHLSVDSPSSQRNSIQPGCEHWIRSYYRQTRGSAQHLHNNRRAYHIYLFIQWQNTIPQKTGKMPIEVIVLHVWSNWPQVQIRIRTPAGLDKPWHILVLSYSVFYIYIIKVTTLSYHLHPYGHHNILSGVKSLQHMLH